MPDPAHPPVTADGRLAQRPPGEVARLRWEADTTAVERSAAWLGAFSAHDAPAAVALAVLVVVSYLPALQGGFVWDDRNISEEPVIHSPAGLRNIWLAPAEIRERRPLLAPGLFSFWLE